MKYKAVTPEVSTLDWARMNFNEVPSSAVEDMMGPHESPLAYVHDLEETSLALNLSPSEILVGILSLDEELVAHAERKGTLGELLLTVPEEDRWVERDFPSWAYLWYPDSWDGPNQLKEAKILSEAGFVVYRSPKIAEHFGLLYGIEGAGYDFFSRHWVPLRARVSLDMVREHPRMHERKSIEDLLLVLLLELGKGGVVGRAERLLTELSKAAASLTG